MPGPLQTSKKNTHTSQRETRYLYKILHQKTVQPIQNMLNLHPLLGKPGGASRTICKTPMLYRHTLRGRDHVAQWEDV